MPVTLSALYVYPVKGLAAIAVREAEVTPRGLQYDRRFMVAGPDGEFFTQRDIPRMATIWTEIDGGLLRLAAPEAGEVSLPLEPADGEPATVRVWSSTCQAIAPSHAADLWLGEYLGTECRLVYMPDDSRRPTNAEYGGPGHIVSFADGYPVLVTNEDSLADLNARIGARGHRAVPMSRFRPNLVIGNAGAFAEDRWTGVRVGSAAFTVAKPCGRCQVTTTDQASGEVQGPEPLATLASFRQHPDFGPLFGANCVIARTGTVRVGDSVEIAQPAAGTALR
jgi:uncharacterized protein YcbX